LKQHDWLFEYLQGVAQIVRGTRLPDQKWQIRQSRHQLAGPLTPAFMKEDGQEVGLGIVLVLGHSSNFRKLGRVSRAGDGAP
jgi:hypothetical protein